MANRIPQPHQPIQKQPRKIISEEDYQSTLSQIVTRDFYPSLPSLRRDAAILEARGRGDIAGAVAIRRAARKEELAREKEWEEDLEEDSAISNEGGSSISRSADGHVLNGKFDNNHDNNYTTRIRKRPRQLKHESITGFHARVTSEDNAEFEINQERERREREKNLAIVYAATADKKGRLLIESGINKSEEETAEKDTNSSSRALLGCDTPLGLASDLYNASPSAGLRLTDGKSNNKSSSGIGRNGLFFQPQHHSINSNNAANKSGALMLTSEAPSGSGTFLSINNGSTENDATKNDGNADENGGADNLLMPPPPARLPSSKSNKNSEVVSYPGDSHVWDQQSNTPSSRPTSHGHYELVEYLPPELSNINPPATRFPYQNESRLQPYNHNLGGGALVSHSGNSSINGFQTDASDTTDLDASPLPLSLERAAHQRAKQRENETFVAMTPLIQPGGGSSNRNTSGLAEEMEEPIMTWGDVANTPLVLGNGMAVDQRSNADASASVDWEPTRPSALSATMGNDSHSIGPLFDVVDDTDREALARCAEKKLIDRAKTYRAAGSSSVQRMGKRPERSSSESRSKSVSKTSHNINPLDRSASLTPAARALLEATSVARNAEKSISRGSSSSKSRIFQPSPITSSASSTRGSNASRFHAGSKDSFGSALRMSYTPIASSSSHRRSRDAGKKKKGSSSSSALRRAAEGATPRNTKFF